MSKSYALIKDGVVQNLIVLAEDSQYTTDCEMVEVPHDHTFEVGFSHDNETGIISAPPISEEEANELSRKMINSEALHFLSSTDWIVIRAMERGEELSVEFKAERDAARARIVQ